MLPKGAYEPGFESVRRGLRLRILPEPAQHIKDRLIHTKHLKEFEPSAPGFESF
jgi:hypothetical protein